MTFEHPAPLTRRQWMWMCGVGAMFRPQQRSTSSATFPRGAIIRTLFRDVEPGRMSPGATLFHEHLSIDLAAIGFARPTGAAPARPPATSDLELMVKQVEAAARDGIVCIVDGGHDDMKRDLEALKSISKQTGMLIVASGGYYLQATYPGDIATRSEEQIADGLVREAARSRHGALGEIGYSSNAKVFTADERKVLRAVGRAHVRSRLPIFTHNAYGTGPDVPADVGLQQLDVLESVGVKPDRVAIGHMCCLDDPAAGVILRLAKRGAFIGFDRVNTLERMVPDDKRVAMAVKLIDAGFARQLLLSSDFTGARALEGPLYGRAVTVFAPKLRAAGVADETVRQILEDNPRRFLAFVPPRG